MPVWSHEHLLIHSSVILSGKFHMEVVVLHNAHWVTWGRKKYFDDIFPALYETLLPSSLDRAKNMGWEGAR